MNYIQMNTEMTKAILDGRKVQTRRVIKVDPVHWDSPTILEPDQCVMFNFAAGGCQNYSPPKHFENSKYKKGEIVWVREPVLIQSTFTQNGIDMFDYVYKADKEEHRDTIPKHHLFKRWMDNNKSIPNGCIKEMARIFLKITNVRVERLQDIKTKDILAEGIIENEKYKIMYQWSKYYKDLEDKWINIWNSTAPKGYKWEDNTYVFVYEFERVEP